METLSITSGCTDDHDRLDGLFEHYRRLKHNDPSAARACFEAFHRGLLRHIACEDDVLFPSFEAKTGERELGPTLVLRIEHQRIRQLLDAIARQRRPGEIGGDEEEQTLFDLLLAHNTQEEFLFYPAFDQAMDDCERGRAWDRVQALLSPDAGKSQPGMTVGSA